MPARKTKTPVAEGWEAARDHLAGLGVESAAIERVRVAVRGRDGVLVIGSGVRFFDAFSVFESRTPEAVLAETARVRGTKFVIRERAAAHAAEVAAYEAGVRADGEWDSGNLAVWMNPILDRLVAEGVLTRRPGRDDEMTANGRPTIYEPAGAA